MLVARHVIPKDDIERVRPLWASGQSGTQRSNRPSHIEFSPFPFRFSAGLQNPTLGRVPFGDGKDFITCPMTPRGFPFATHGSEDAARELTSRLPILAASEPHLLGVSVYVFRESTKLYGGQGPLKSNLTDFSELC